jgi:hypothetical protein
VDAGWSVRVLYAICRMHANRMNGGKADSKMCFVKVSK